ncbi:uncharacterized protein FIBRA_03714 [Fibroporia radiculosa]|uniref:Uncharacterized protein n=1 Tax=Fibroporia radiculosa TaxID=599839 RepID=J4G678_9APHY|nr:uncharacterized protein FIBRA_03714 [Fibroporia radiculosa]CCM01653.1 predicted protein [Fibroporia radiculosa]
MTSTAFCDMSSVETQKQRYSRELAAYTLQQWELARRQALEKDRTKNKPSSSSRTSAGPKDTNTTPRASQGQVAPLPTGDGDRVTNTVAGIQSIDYASKLRNGAKYEGRVLATRRA